MAMLYPIFSRNAPHPLDPGQEILTLLGNPFAGQQVQQNSLYTAFATSLGFSAFIALCFSFLRPYNQAVYAPKLKHANDRNAPPPVGRSLFAWITPIWRMPEHELIHHVGMDATVFLRFTRMCRDILLTLAVLLCLILLPVHWVYSLDSTSDLNVIDQKWLSRLTPANVWGAPMWAQVISAWVVNVVVAAFLWWNYRKIVHMRRAYFASEEYLASMHARTLMLYDIPAKFCSDEGIARLIDRVVPDGAFSRTAIARNVRDLPKLIQEFESAIRQLEKVLAKYFRDPANLPASRPTCKPLKDDPDVATYSSGHRVDAIDYLTRRVSALELEIQEVRRTVDKRSSICYGFATYDNVAEAHRIAFAARRTKPDGTAIKLAPRPNDIIWDNMPLKREKRRFKRWMNTFWVTLLTLLWIGPNAMIAIFLVNLSNLGKVWPAFDTSLNANTGLWGAVQGILSPALLSLFYLILPIVFRRMAIRAGYQTKTQRELHVVAKLYSFFVINNLLIFTFFSAIWGYAAGIVQAAQKGQDAWATLSNDQVPQGLFVAICTISPFWVTWLLQRQLGAAIDLTQLWPLAYGFLMKRFSSPTPRELIELTAPPPFDYASYYNYFLFYTTVALFYSGIQPLVLPAAALYFCIDVFLKKYLILYVFATKTESGGVFWRTLVDRLIAGTIFSNLVVFLTVWVRGYGNHVQAWAVIPLPLLMLVFRWVCIRVYDHQMKFYSTTGNAGEDGLKSEVEPDGKGSSKLRSERLATRFGNPALYKPLMTPMVSERAKGLFSEIYKGRLADGRGPGVPDVSNYSGYSDSYPLDRMAAGGLGKTEKTEKGVPGFEFVADSQLDYEHYCDHPDFASDNGDLDNIHGDDRPGTPASYMGSIDGRRLGSPVTGPERRVFSPLHQMHQMPQQPAGGYLPLRPPVASSSSAAGPFNNSSTALVHDMDTGLGVREDGSRDASWDSSRAGTPAAGLMVTPSTALGPAGSGGEEPGFDYFKATRGSSRF